MLSVKIILLLLVALRVVVAIVGVQSQERVPDKMVATDVFQVKRIRKDLGNFHAYTMLDEKRGRTYFMRCFGLCPAFSVGERWLLSYKTHERRFHSCYSFICQYSTNRSVSATIVKAKSNHKIKSASGETFHEKYIGLLSIWFEKPSTIAVFSALALNDKRFFDQKIWQVFKRTGTSHLVAMSGLHVGLAVGLICRLLMTVCCFSFPTWFGRRSQIIRNVLVLSMALSLFFLVNESYSIERAITMYVFSCLVGLFGFYVTLKSLLKYTAILLFLIDPGIVLSVGAWLSFFTVWVIIRYSAGLSQLDNMWLSGPVQHGLIFVFLTPLCLYFFHSFSLLAPIVNVIAIPWFSLTVIPLVILSLFSSFFSVVLAKHLALLASYFFEPIYDLLGFAASLPHTQVQVHSFSLWLLVLSLTTLVLGLRCLPFNRSYGSI